MKTSGRYEIKRWVLGYGAEVEVLKAEELREEIKEDINRLNERYA